jgi:predicted Zn-dependent protease with MMP-like domain
VDPRLRELFDVLLQAVIAEAPPQIRGFLDEVPLTVDDRPTREQLRLLNVRRGESLCGLYTGIPLTERSVLHSGVLSDAVHLFREGIVHTTISMHGRLSEKELKRQIQITLWHELGHHVGLNEQDLEELGYG